MKTKNVMLAVFVFVFALGSAFVSISANDQASQYVDDPPMGAREINPVDCGSGEIACQVSIDGASNNPYHVYEDQTLQTQVLGSANLPIETTFK